MSPGFAPANLSLSHLETQGTYESPFPLPAGGPVLTSCVLAAVIGAQRPLRQHKPPEPPPSPSLRSLHRSLFRPSLPPTPTQSLRTASLFVPDSSRAILKPSSDYARRDKDRTALWGCPIDPAVQRSPHKDYLVFSKPKGGHPVRPPIQ
jgi:hypothetical protein